MSPELASLGSTAQQLAESVRLIQAQQQLIMDSQRAQEQRQLLLQQDELPPNPTPPTPPPTTTPPLIATASHLHRKPDPPNRTFRTIVLSQLQPSLLLTNYKFHHHQHADHDPGLQDHVPIDLLDIPITIANLLNVQLDLVLLFLVIDHPQNTPRTAEPHPHTDEDHHHDDALRWFLDVIDLTHAHAPRHHVTDPEAVKSYFDQLQTHPIRPTSPLPTLMTPGAHGTTAITPTTTTTTLLDPTLLPIHRHLNQLHHPPAHTSAPLGAVSFRVPDGDSENSEVTDTISLTKFDTNDIDLDEMVAAVNDPHRVRCLTELGPDHVVPLRQSLTPAILQLFNQFVDAMFEQLAKPYRTVNNHRIYIKASQATVRNIARAFAQSDLLDIELARQTQAFYIEPENLLTITVPTGLKKKPIYRGEHMGTYLIYHKTSWESVAKILAEDCIRPATWTKNEAGIPTQYPCYGFFGMSSEIADIDNLPGYAVKICTSQLYKIGKGQNPSGLLAICRSPKCIRALAGGNDQIQRLCNLAGIAKGKDNATAMNSSAASICYVASTHTVFPGLITHQTAETNAPSEPPDDSARPVRPDPSADAPEPSEPPPDDSRDTPSHRETAASGSRNYARRSWHDNASWDNSTYSRRDRRSSYHEDHSRDQHHDGRPRF